MLEGPNGAVMELDGSFHAHCATPDGAHRGNDPRTQIDVLRGQLILGGSSKSMQREGLEGGPQLQVGGVCEGGGGSEAEVQPACAHGTAALSASPLKDSTPGPSTLPAPPPPPPPLPHTRAQIGELLGEGTFGKVYKGLWRGSEVAIKAIVLPAKMSGKAKREKMAVMEAAISSSLAHPNIVQVRAGGPCGCGFRLQGEISFVGS